MQGVGEGGDGSPCLLPATPLLAAVKASPGLTLTSCARLMAADTRLELHLPGRQQLCPRLPFTTWVRTPTPRRRRQVGLCGPAEPMPLETAGGAG